jgi:hypothetical protein
VHPALGVGQLDPVAGLERPAPADGGRSTHRVTPWTRVRA